jgi:chemotaxis protein methyltransferase CheR
MNDRECVELLQWALPRLGLRWRGFKNVRRQVCRRVSARASELGIPDAASYRRRLEDDADERRALDALCFVTISRFYRDHRIYEALQSTFLPALSEAARARGARRLRVWSAGCASGEEPYTLAILWRLELASRFPELDLDLVATDFDGAVLARAAQGLYEPSSLRELPSTWNDVAFERQGDLLRVRDEFRRGITFVREDVRRYAPQAPLDLVLCRNVAFTYFDEAAQRRFVDRVVERLVPKGVLVVGAHETIPDGIDALEPCGAHVYVRR